jgi:hypothetical protein
MAHTVVDQSAEKPWYRQFWPWFLMVPPAASVIAGLLTFYLAGSPPSMVVDDYGKIAMATEQRVEREQRAEALGLDAKIEFIGGAAETGQPVAITLSQRVDNNLFPDRVRLKLVHPTLEAMDREVILEGTSGQYYGRIQRPESRVYISLTDLDGNWRLTGELFEHSTHYEFGSASRGGP